MVIKPENHFGLNCLQIRIQGIKPTGIKFSKCFHIQNIFFNFWLKWGFPYQSLINTSKQFSNIYHLSKPPHCSCTSWNNEPQENSYFTTLTQPEVHFNYNGSKPDHRSCEVCFLCKNSCLEKHLQTAAFVILTGFLTKLLKKK